MALQNAISLPSGSITYFAGAAAPAGWFLCYGQAISRTTYAGLFLAIGTTYGVGDGATTFNLPDARGRALFAKDDMGGSAANRLTTGGGGVNGAALGEVGGGETVTLTTTTMPTHTHTQNAHAHQQSYDNATPATQYTGGVSSSSPNGFTPSSASRNTGAVGVNTQSATATNQNNGSSGAHANIPPAIVMNLIIKA